ncbi:MAG: hypothetical protein JSV06_07075 [Myxococcales bacterium]|nr:MAG: hypothetical protein JSV06_07075 [Myxococcales bacterium]
MSLDAAARRRYARQLLLGEIGEAGQKRLLTARCRRGSAADADAFAVAAEYLRRAGCSIDEGGEEVRIPDAVAVSRFAGTTSLHETAAAVVGAFCAVEHIKATLGLGDACEFPHALTLSSEG